MGKYTHALACQASMKKRKKIRPSVIAKRDRTWKIDDWNTTCHHIGNLRLFLCVSEAAMAPWCGWHVENGDRPCVSLSLNASPCVHPLLLWICWQCVVVLILFNEQISGLTLEDNEKQHCRKRQSAKTVVHILRTLLHIRPNHVYIIYSLSKRQVITDCITCSFWPKFLYEYTDFLPAASYSWAGDCWIYLFSSQTTDSTRSFSVTSLHLLWNVWKPCGGCCRFHLIRLVFLLLQYFWVCTGCFSFFMNWILSATTVSVLLPVLICSVQLDDVPSFLKKTDCIFLVLQSGKPEKCQACLVESKVLSGMATFTTWVGEMKVTV